MRPIVRTDRGQVRTLLTRVLAFVLLGGIIQTVTFGAAHNHLDYVNISDRSQLGGSAPLSEYAVPDPLHLQTQRQECLVCVFHQQLFNGAVHSGFLIAEPVLSGAGTSIAKPFHYSSSFTSTPIARRSGRAPPQN